MLEPEGRAAVAFVNPRPQRARSAVCAPLQGAPLRRARAVSPGKSRCERSGSKNTRAGPQARVTDPGRKPGDHGSERRRRPEYSRADGRSVP